MILPGLIDVHTHLRVPGGEHKEDFATGTAAALAGGITMILAMPNTSPPIATPAVLADTLTIAQQSIRCDVGLYAGASGEHLSTLGEMARQTAALKIYLNDTFGTLRIDDVPTLIDCFKIWPKEKPIALHAEKQSMAVAIAMSAVYDRPVHIVHVSRKEEIELIADAKMRGLKVTCEVAPHHLFLNQSDFERLGPLADMRPVLGTPEDVASLWSHINDTVDCIATDHAPHTLEEKRSANPPPGIVGLQTSLPLMWTAVTENRLSQKRLVELMHHNPKKIFDLPEQPDTFVEIEPEVKTTIRNSDILSRCGWTPFDGREVVGKIKRVILRGEEVFAHGQVIAEPGSGRVITANSV
ncbi:MAG: amidohydrolase family protein [Ardenticatenaceae bacterium]|nr:amidohydrolase family protein [Ardenticatenaceae bacterium]